MAILTTQTINHDGLDPTYTAASSGGDKITPGRRVFLHVQNGGSGSVVVTVDDTLSPEPTGSAAFNPDLEVTIEPSGDRYIGPIVETRFQNAEGYADVTYDQVDTVTIAALSV